MNAVDTNVLIYVHDPRDPLKQAIANSLVHSLSDGVLLWQVACEFIAASRKLAPYGFSREEAWQEINLLQSLWTTKLPRWSILQRAEALQVSHSLSIWDAMIVAACLEGGVACLYSEDFDAYSQVESLTLVNPFKTP